MSEIIIPRLTVEKPDPTPHHGARRIVKITETPVGWGWILWKSPYTVIDPDVGKIPSYKCVVLIIKGPPKPEIAVFTMPATLYDKLPEDSVEW